LIAWWSGDGHAWNIQGFNHGVVVNGADFDAGKVGLSFALGGINDFVQVPDSPSWAFGTNDFAVELWVKSE
jgi:hypothetical protein